MSCHKCHHHGAESPVGEGCVYARDGNLVAIDKQGKRGETAKHCYDETHLGSSTQAQVQLLTDIGPWETKTKRSPRRQTKSCQHVTIGEYLSLCKAFV